VVEASIAGSIIGNVLLALGAARLAGALCYPEQHFNPAGARSQATMLMLAAIAPVVRTACEATSSVTAAGLNRLSVSTSIVLLGTYALYLVYSLNTHNAPGSGIKPETGHKSEQWGVFRLFNRDARERIGTFAPGFPLRVLSPVGLKRLVYKRHHPGLA
jgi:Ca2+:H+ antiporter